jgi:UDP:flavonoid glycosyltransferase YjiC (YdhE family)
MRMLAACSLGGAGHFNPLVTFLHAARRRGDEVLTVGPPALRQMVESAGFPFRAGGEPSEEQVAAIRERLPVVAAAEASLLGNRELFGRLATGAMLAGMEDAWRDWVPDLVLRDPTEYASAVLAARTRTPIAQGRDLTGRGGGRLDRRETDVRTRRPERRISPVDVWLPEPRRNGTKRDEADGLR